MPIPLLAAAAAKALAAKAAAAKAASAKIIGSAAKGAASKAIGLAEKSSPIKKGKLSLSMLADKNVNLSPGTVSKTAMDTLKEKGGEYLDKIKEGDFGKNNENKQPLEFSKSSRSNLDIKPLDNTPNSIYSDQIKKLNSLK